MKRAILVVAVIICATSAAQAQRATAGTDAGGYEVIANAFGFGIDIPGCADASKNIREIDIDDLTIDARELTTGLDVEYRQYAPGYVHFGNARLAFALSPDDACLKDWFAAARAGKSIRKNITVSLFKSDKTPGRSYLLHDAFPISFGLAQSDTDTAGQGLEVLTVQVGRVSFDGGSRESPRNAPAVNGFVVEAVASRGTTLVVDVAWESCTGGAEAIEVHPASFGADADTKRSFTDVTLRGPMTTSRGWLAGLLNDVARGIDTRVTLRCANAKGGRGYIYTKAFPVAYVFPKMSVTNTTGNTIEEVRIKPIRCELK